MVIWFSASLPVLLLSRVQLFATPWTTAHQAPPSPGVSRQEDWSGLPSPSPGDLPDPETKLMSPALADRFLTAEPPGLPISLLGCHNRKPRLGGSKNKSISHSPGAWKSKIKTPSSGWVSGGNSPPGGRTATSSLHPHMASAPCG